MLRARTIVSGLRFVALTVMIFGFIGIVNGVVDRGSIRLAAFQVPLWIPGLVVMGFGYVYWRRVPRIEAKLGGLGEFGPESAGVAVRRKRRK